MLCCHSPKKNVFSDHRSGVALATRRRLCGLYHLQGQVLRTVAALPIFVVVDVQMTHMVLPQMINR